MLHFPIFAQESDHFSQIDIILKTNSDLKTNNDNFTYLQKEKPSKILKIPVGDDQLYNELQIIGIKKGKKPFCIITSIQIYGMKKQKEKKQPASEYKLNVGEKKKDEWNKYLPKNKDPLQKPKQQTTSMFDFLKNTIRKNSNSKNQEDQDIERIKEISLKEYEVKQKEDQDLEQAKIISQIDKKLDIIIIPDDCIEESKKKDKKLEKAKLKEMIKLKESDIRSDFWKEHEICNYQQLTMNIDELSAGIQDQRQLKFNFFKL